MKPIREYLIESWELFKSKWVVLVLIQVFAALAIILSSSVLGVENFFQQEFKPSLEIFWKSGWVLLGLVFSIAIQTWAIGASILAIKEKKVDFNQAFNAGFIYFLSFLLAGLVNTLAVILGLLLLIVPGVILAVWFSLYSYLIVVERVGPMESLKKSREMVRGHFWDVTNRWGVIILLSFLARLVAASLNVSAGGISVTDLLLELILTPFTLIYGFLIYQDLKSLKAKKNV